MTENISSRLEHPHLEHGEVVVEESGAGQFQQHVFTSHHHLVADEPKNLGGDDAGPSPYEYLLSALGACTSMTLRMYAKHKKIPLEKTSVRLKHDRAIGQITKQISLYGNLTDEQRKRLIEISARCPVQKTLTSEISIVTQEIPV